KHSASDNRRGRGSRRATNQGPVFGPWRTIVGVVSTVRMLGPFNTPGLDDSGFYVPFYSVAAGPASAEPFVNQFATVAVRPRGGQRADALANALRREIQQVDPSLPVDCVGTPHSQLDGFVAPNRIIATMFTIFGVVAMVLASVGIYGV